MILGMGSDMVDIRRIEKSLTRFGDRFVNRVFSEEEKKKARTRKEAGAKVYAGTLAKRFAAKEACSKALGTGFQQGVFMKDISVVNLPSGKPTLVLAGGAKAALDKLAGSTKTEISLTMTDEYPYAQAVVIISAI